MTEGYIKYGNELIADFLGYKYSKENVLYDVCDDFQYKNYQPIKIYSKVPILTEEDGYGYHTLIDLPNPDYGKEQPKKWGREYKTIPWASINSHEHIVDLKYDKSWDSLMDVVEKICAIDNEADLEYARELFAADLDILHNTSIMCPKEEVYFRVIKFIEWYNHNNEQRKLYE